jgi:urate oxidase
VAHNLLETLFKQITSQKRLAFPMKLTANRYGKAKVRILKRLRENGIDTFKDLEVKIILEGAFTAAYTAGNNRKIVPTDTMKNTVNVLAYEKLGSETEPFVTELTAHFLDKYPQVNNVEVETEERLWERITVNGLPSPTNFSVAGKMIPITRVIRSRDHLEVDSGISQLMILKSAGSGFSGFNQDELTTLPETKDRLLATSLTSQWRYRTRPDDYCATNAGIVDAMLSAFGSTDSPSVQATLYEMGKAALAKYSAIEQISLTMPNLHCLQIDLSPFHRQNENVLFVPTDAPQGWIEGTVARYDEVGLTK